MATKAASCPVEKTLKIIGKKWAALIIRDLLLGTRRFGQLLTSLQGISPRTLSARLDELEQDGIVKKRVFAEMPPHVEYSLTRRGHNLHAIIDSMRRWGKQQ